MVAIRKAGLVTSLASFLGAYLFIQIAVICTDMRSETAARSKTTKQPKLTMIDTRRVNVNNPRDEFVYSLQPWRVKAEFSNASHGCRNTAKHARQLRIVVFVKSATAYRDRRNAIRQTWGKISHVENVALHVIFVLGMGPPDVQNALRQENEKYGDILQFIGVDDYRHIVYKVLAGMQWAKENLPKYYLYASADDDLLVNLALFARRLRMHLKRAEKKLSTAKDSTLSALLLHMPILCVFSYREKESPVRDRKAHWGKYYLDPREFPMDILPPFCLGGWYMMPVERVVKLYDASRIKRAISMDDVWITGVLRIRIQPDTIEPIDKSALLRGSDHVKHLWGDFKTNQNITDAVSEAWAPVWKEIRSKKHCIRNGLHSAVIRPTLGE